MKNYEKPVVMVNEGLAEGVYAASGANHWNVTYYDKENQTDYYRVDFSNAGVCHVNEMVQTVTIDVTFSEAFTSVDERSKGCTVSNIGNNTARVVLTGSACRPNENHSLNLYPNPNSSTQKITGVSIYSCEH